MTDLELQAQKYDDLKEAQAELFLMEHIEECVVLLKEDNIHVLADMLKNLNYTIIQKLINELQ